MNIGDAARASGVSAKMIRYYEQNGLIPPADRTASGYRDYSNDDVDMLRFIRRSRDLGFATREINELLVLWRDGSRHSADVKRVASMHIASLRAKIGKLQQMVDRLQTLSASCSGDNHPDCSILADLETDDGNTSLTELRTGAVNRFQ